MKRFERGRSIIGPTLLKEHSRCSAKSRGERNKIRSRGTRGNNAVMGRLVPGDSPGKRTMDRPEVMLEG